MEAAPCYHRLRMHEQAIGAYECRLKHCRTAADRDKIYEVIESLKLKKSSEDETASGTSDWDEVDGVLVSAETPLGWTEYQVEALDFEDIEKVC